MLHQDVLMVDIDVDQWRNAQALLLRSAKSLRRLVVIHERGQVVKFRHTHDEPVRGAVTRVADPHRLARELYRVNQEVVDFVVVMERDAVDSYFAEVQDSWRIDEDLDEFVQRTYATLDSYADGIVTYPGAARETLGLRWRLGASHEQVSQAVTAHVVPGSTVVLGVVKDGGLWASLVLGFDDDHRVTSVTTVDPSVVDVRGGHAELASRLVADASLALVLDYDAAASFLAAPASLGALRAGGSATLRRR